MFVWENERKQENEETEFWLTNNSSSFQVYEAIEIYKNTLHFDPTLRSNQSKINKDHFENEC